jgi:hypothetical protein
MKTIAGRVSQLEKRFTPSLDDRERSPADVLRERRLRRLAAEGQVPEEEPRILVDSNNRPLTIREVLRNRFR